MRRIFVIGLGAILLLLVLTASVALYLVNDQAFIKQRLAAYALETTGRQLIVNGTLDLSLGLEASLEARDITFANADWAETPHMVDVGRLFVRIHLPSLFDNWVYLPDVQLEDCAIELLSNDQGEANWDVWPADDNAPDQAPVEDATWKVAINDLLIRNCSLRLDGPERESPLTVEVELAEVERRLARRAEGRIAGRINGEPLSVDGWVEPLSAFRDGGPVKHELHFRAGDVLLDSRGSIADAVQLTGIEFSGHFRGPDIGRVLKDYELPPLSAGAFDFRVDLSNLDGLTHFDVNGDLGELKVVSEGRFDSLLEPRKGNIVAQVSGPDLQSLGLALGVQGLVPETYEIDADIALRDGLLHFERAIMATERDRLEFSGDLALSPGLASSQLTASLHSEEIGRWWPLFGKPERPVGPADLALSGAVDEAGDVTLDAEITHLQSTLQVSGPLGHLKGPYEPSLDFVFHSKNMPQLAALLGEDSFPAKPFDLSGRLVKRGNELLIENLLVVIEEHKAVVNGQLNLINEFSNSRFDIALDIPNAARFGRLFGVPDLPSEPFQVEGTVQLDGDGLSFRVADSDLGGITLQAKGAIPDLDDPLGIDADFNLHLPSLRLISIFMPDLQLPVVPLTASGHLVNQQDRTRVDDIQLTLGNLNLGLQGNFNHQAEFDLEVEIDGDDLSAVAAAFDKDLPAIPFSVDTTVAGNPTSMRFRGIDIMAGKSRINGNIDLRLGEVTVISGALDSPYLDLSPFVSPGEETDDAASSEPPSKYVFPDKPLTPLSDFGLDIDTRLKADRLILGHVALTEFDIGVRLQGQSLEVKPFTLRDPTGGQFSGEFLYSQRDSVPDVYLNLLGREQRMLFGLAEGQDPTTVPLGQYTVLINGSGRTQRELAASLDGKIRANFGPGNVASMGINLLVGDFLTELLDLLNPTTERQEFTQLDCAVLAADIVDGRVKLQPGLVQTNRITVISEGLIDLQDESIDISFNSKQRKGLGLSASDLVNPFIKVGGTLARPAIELDPASTVVKGSIAVATAGLSILARSMAGRFLSSKDPCGDALREINARDGKKP